MRGFVADLRRRNVVREAAACIAVAELLMQLIDNLAPLIRCARVGRQMRRRCAEEEQL